MTYAQRGRHCEDSCLLATEDFKREEACTKSIEEVAAVAVLGGDRWSSRCIKEFSFSCAKQVEVALH